MTRYAVIGAGFAGLAIARDLVRAGQSVTVFEADAHVGGLAGSFDPDPAVGGEPIDRFYHHWFTSDIEIMDLVAELGLSESVSEEPTLTGVHYANRVLRLSTPLDLLRFPALSLPNRLRLGLLALRARRVTDWRGLEGLTAAEWLVSQGGEVVYRAIWEPLLRGKFGSLADEVSAVWIWNKLKLRGGSRGKGGEERLAYVRGSFARVADAMAAEIRNHGGRIETRSAIREISPNQGGGWKVAGPWGAAEADTVIATTAPSLLAGMISDWADPALVDRLLSIAYLANICLVLELDRALGETYWLNVTDPSFPFVGIIEHTNFRDPAEYGGRHVVYLSRYLPQDDPLLAQDDRGVLDFALPHLQRMFPQFDPASILRFHVWRAMWAQPVVRRNYASLVPSEDVGPPGLHLCSMAQIYPEDRGTNHAVKAGRQLARRLLSES